MLLLIGCMCRRTLDKILHLLQTRFQVPQGTCFSRTGTAMAGVEFSKLSSDHQSVSFECSWRGRTFTQDSAILPGTQPYPRCAL